MTEISRKRFVERFSGKRRLGSDSVFSEKDVCISDNNSDERKQVR